MGHGVSQIMRRIHAIEARFSLNQAKGAGNFQAFMQTELKGRRMAADQKSIGVNRAVQSAFTSDAPRNISKLILQSAQKYGVDPKLVDAVARTESNYRPDAVSEAGAVGVMQLMPETAASLGVRNMYDPRENIEGGTKYIKQLLTSFDGDVSKAVAAYNAGPQAVKNYEGVPPYRETKDYVRKVLDIYS